MWVLIHIDPTVTSGGSTEAASYLMSRSVVSGVPSLVLVTNQPGLDSSDDRGSVAAVKAPACWERLGSECSGLCALRLGGAGAKNIVKKSSDPR